MLLFLATIENVRGNKKAENYGTFGDNILSVFRNQSPYPVQTC